MLNGGTLNYFAVPWGIINNPLPLFLVTVIEVVLLGAAEKYRCACQFTLSYEPLPAIPKPGMMPKAGARGQPSAHLVF